MATGMITGDFLGKEIQEIINKKVEELANEQIEEQVKLFREKMYNNKAEVVTGVLAKVFELYDRFGQEIVIKVPIDKIH